MYAHDMGSSFICLHVASQKMSFSHTRRRCQSVDNLQLAMSPRPGTGARSQDLTRLTSERPTRKDREPSATRSGESTGIVACALLLSFSRHVALHCTPLISMSPLWCAKTTSGLACFAFAREYQNPCWHCAVMDETTWSSR